jgi:hypothetical protein
MFTGFASENTPAIQVWDYFRAYTGQTSISLTDDCAPIQYFKTGGSTDSILLYLPSAPIEGKQIKIINSRYGGNAQPISIYVSDRSGGGTNASIFTLGQGQTLDLCYSKNFISFGTSSGSSATGWITLNQSPPSAANSSSLVACGGNSNAFGTSTFVAAGNSNNARGNNSSVVGGNSNLASGTDAVSVGGSNNTASSTSCFVGGGSGCTASSTNCFVGSGSGNTASGSASTVINGNNNLANSTNGIVISGSYGTTRSIVGNAVLPASNSPIASAAGVTQLALLVLGVQTTDATATVLRSNTSAATTTNQVILPNNSAYVFQGTCIANVTGGSTTSGWKFEGVIKRGVGVGTTALVAAVTPTVIAQDALAATWVLAITADTTNGGIAVTVTGAAATTIRWVSRIETTEVTF